MILRKKALENGNFIVQQKLGDAHLTVSDLRVGHGNISVPFLLTETLWSFPTTSFTIPCTVFCIFMLGSGNRTLE
jgi:hypothetical protein